MNLTIVDAFATEPFTGNPAAVCLLEHPAEPEWMQQVAAEMNLSETAFVSPRSDDSFDLRWFTPTTEVNLCGHATLASAHVLFERGRAGDVTFHTKSGPLVARRQDDGVTIDLPSDPPRTAVIPGELESILGTRPMYYGLSREMALVEVASDKTVRDLTPRMAPIASLIPGGLIVTAASAGGEIDFVSRFFAPGCGIPEDPVTGSAHCVLAPYWAKALDKVDFVAHQASRRGGTLRVRLAGDRVFLTGGAVTVVRGALCT